MNRRFEKTLLIHGQLVLRPIDSADKLETINEHVSALEDAVKGENEEGKYLIRHLRDQITYLLGLGHASDCPAKDTIGECLCGNVEAEKWLAENKK